MTAALNTDAGVQVERQGLIGFITLNRPETGNSVDLGMGLALRDAVRSLVVNPPSVVVLRSSGAHFMVGGDVRRFEALLNVSNAACADELETLISAVNEAVTGLTQLPCPVLALINGAAAGFGLSLALACDILVAADDASFLMAYSAIGATPDGGATWHLPRQVGLHRAMAIALLNPKLSAADAKAAGLVTEVVPRDELHTAGLAIAQRLADGPAAAHAGIKRLLRSGLDATLETALAAEKATFVAVSASADFAEGVAAFCQRRKTQFGASR
ncbi:MULTISPECIES: enoyl-CoA hydratase/isomerase family protein [unclassified Pseudomonas]|uniref:enoyl-CoA hydratase/isomerase family protein n=1 Tax=unclassified Pseudomonas TaxID=196821 RepID=UPI0015A2C298|nr:MULTISPECIES: enoyl-CoA hydratase-related protein [unclassified Pseudomonas]NVZ17630.1 enoyl-CoA hydratase/isomerase family protein [Pseudomonas sp. IPO3775]NWA80436.1 enoyl-CoA hydratase/isomerase family protein [Pseudomonas sp. C8002]